MVKWQNDTMLDQALLWIKNSMDKVSICKSQPTTYSQAITSYKLGIASHTVASSPTSGASSGRKVIIPKKSSIAIASSGKMQHVALIDAGSTTLLYVTTIPTSSQASVSSPDKVNMATWDITIADVTNP